jgi:hypothetical protein
MMRNGMAYLAQQNGSEEISAELGGCREVRNL